MRQSGFTATELLIGMAIIAIIATLAVPTLGNLIENSRLTTTTNMLVEALMTARSEAVKRGEPVRVIPGDGDIGVQVVVSNDNSLIRSFDNEITTGDGADSPVFLKFSEDIEFVEYQANGIRTGGAAAIQIYVCNRAGTKGRRIDLGVTGSTQVEQLEGACP
ncbi:MAG: GspH/FimT family pseudopilin [Pseudomonadota bacterium]